MKEKEEVKIQGKPAFYACLYNDMKRAALDCGYTLAIHGSMHRDLDLIAVAWSNDSKMEVELVKALNECIGATVWSEHNFTTREVKAHGRVVYTLSILGDWFIDLSIIPPAGIWAESIYTKDLCAGAHELIHMIDTEQTRYIRITRDKLKSALDIFSYQFSRFVNCPDIEWTPKTGDDFGFKFEDYHLRVEQMDKKHWWWRVYFKGETIADSSYGDGLYAITEKESKTLCELNFLRHWIKQYGIKT